MPQDPTKQYRVYIGSRSKLDHGTVRDFAKSISKHHKLVKLVNATDTAQLEYRKHGGRCIQ